MKTRPESIAASGMVSVFLLRLVTTNSTVCYQLETC